jgi:16S rRNA (cytidine1402-2'-O)-methyltransferase
MTDNSKLGILYLVGTPIGNLEDITLRAIRILQEVDAIAAEDTRRTGKLLQHLNICTPQISYYEHNHNSRIQELVNRLQRGDKIALVTDAGMPSISDPGYQLVTEVIAAKIRIVPIPGGTAAIASLAVSGLPTDRFVFEGFLPLKEKYRREQLEVLHNETRTMVFYEAPHRLVRTLTDFQQVFGGDRPLVLARELTKIYEEIWRGTIEEAIALYTDNRQPKGEYTLVVAGTTAEVSVLSQEELKKELQQLLARGLTRSQASRQLAKSTSWSRRDIYQLDLETE